MSPAKKPTTRSKAGAPKRAAKKTSAKKRTAKKTTVRKSTAKKTTAKKTGTKTTAKQAPRKAPARRPAQTAAKKTAAPRPARPAKFDKKALASIREQLTDEVRVLEQQVKELEEDSFEGTQSDMTGEVGLDEDFADAGTATFERERDLSIRNNIRDLIDQITRAIGRIDEGTYGTCERCGRPIDAARLKALPHALLCMECKRREERAR
ncbi:MAG: TraR/DksA C4-type zinc finger protein [Actinomycetota bacterium]